MKNKNILIYIFILYCIFVFRFFYFCYIFSIYSTIDYFNLFIYYYFNMDCISTNIKKIGNREEVYKGLAYKTAGGLTNTDIIEKNFNGKLIYISKKISENMKAQMQLIHSNTQYTNNLDSNTITTQQLKDFNKNKKIIKKNKKTLAALKSNTTNLLNKYKSKTHKNISFQITNNEVKNKYYPELKGIDLKDLKEDLIREEEEEDNCIENVNKKSLEPFKVEELPDIDINYL